MKIPTGCVSGVFEGSLWNARHSYVLCDKIAGSDFEQGRWPHRGEGQDARIKRRCNRLLLMELLIQCDEMRLTGHYLETTRGNNHEVILLEHFTLLPKGQDDDP